MTESGVPNAESAALGADPEPALAFESVEALDAELAKVARRAGLLRLGIADGLEVLACADGHHEMGFATVEAYALERCERSARWVQESRWLSRRLKELPLVRRALVQSRVTFSMAQVIAKAACRDDEAQWLSAASRRTVRAMRALVKVRLEAGRQMSAAPDATGRAHTLCAKPDATGQMSATPDATGRAFASRPELGATG